MNSQGIQFGMDGPVMTGTWMNPKTGHKFTVQDCFFEDGQFRVQTTTGQVLDYNAIQDYIQTTNTVQEPSQPTHTNQNQIPAEIQSMIDGDDDLILPEDRVSDLGNLNTPRRSQPIANYAQVINSDEEMDMNMIKRVLRNAPLPELDASIKWPSVPVKQIDTLINILGIDPSTIATYYINQLDREAIFNYFVQALGKYIDGLVTTENAVASTEEPKSKSKTNHKSNKKKS